MSNKTVGETIVRTDFNPSANDVVSQIKTAGAELINVLAATEQFAEDAAHLLATVHHNHLVRRAIEHVETAVMLAVKHQTAKRMTPASAAAAETNGQ